MRSYAAIAAALGLFACKVPPPASQLPNAQAAVDRMRATTACGTGVQADAKLDHFSSESGRIRTELLMIASRPARLRMDILVTGAGSVATLTTDGTNFQATDKRENRFLFGMQRGKKGKEEKQKGRGQEQLNRGTHFSKSRFFEIGS